ncbi:MAG TPA: glycosyltransferase family 39 protein [Gaiellaceae bacterium]|nr:glycosyltransferase family 39 protein [Gaiellaceae bacterium]
MTAVAQWLHVAGLRRLAVSPWAAALALAGAAGAGLRVWEYRSILGGTDADEALAGLIARHVLNGELTAFFWSMAYGGTQEPLLTAPLFWLFGSGWLALRSVPIALSAVAALLVWRAGRRTLGEPGAAVAGALFWVWPGYNLIQLTHQHGFYGSDVFYCALLVLLALRVVERPDAVRTGAFGLALGLGFWETAQVVPVAVPLVLWTVWRRPAALRRLPVALPLAALGALPWIVWNVRHDWASLDVSFGAQSTYAHRLRIFVSPLLPMITGLRQPWTQERLLPAALTLLVYALLAALFLRGAVRSRSSDASVLYAVALGFPFLYAISAWTIEAGEPRYLVVLTPVLALLAAQLATSRARGLAVLALGLALSVAVLHRAEVSARASTAPGPPGDLRPLEAELERLGVDRFYSTYWVAYKVTFETRERIVGVKNDFTAVSWDGEQAQPALGAFIRYPPFERAVREGRHAFVLYRALLPSIPIVPRLERYGYRRHDVGTLAVYTLPRGRQ